jgi:hypothetical protein
MKFTEIFFYDQIFFLFEMKNFSPFWNEINESSMKYIHSNGSVTKQIRKILLHITLYKKHR